MSTEKIYITLLEEGTPTARPTQAENLGNGTYKVLPTPNYNPENEVWEFLPGSIVRCKNWESSMGEVLLAYEAVK
jgi:hypothetical protein